MKPNSKMRAERIVVEQWCFIELRFPIDGAVIALPFGGVSDVARANVAQDIRSELAREFRAVRRQALLSAAKAVAKRAEGAADLPGYVNGLDDAAQMLRDMAAPKLRKGP